MNELRLIIGVFKTVKNWPDYISDYFGWTKKKNLTYLLRNGIKIKTRARTADRGIINEIYVLELYTPKGMEIGKNDVVLEIGAHIGSFSVYSSKKAKKVYSFEPMPENFELLKQNIKLNRCINVQPIQKAVSDKKETAGFFISKVNTGGHSLFSDENGRRIKVQTITLKDFFEEYEVSKIDFLKMDCEGAEYRILYTCPPEILDKISKISMEYHNVKGESIQKLKKFLETKNFKVSTTTGEFPMLYAVK